MNQEGHQFDEGEGDISLMKGRSRYQFDEGEVEGISLMKGKVS